MARVQAQNACPIFGSSEGAYLANSVRVGAQGDALGISIAADVDGNTNSLIGVYPELKAADAILAAAAVVTGFYSRMLVNKAQTNDSSIFGAELQCRVKANMGNGVHAGAWCYWEQSGTATCTGEDAAVACAVESAAGLTATQLSGVQIGSSVHASATVTNFSAVRVQTGTSAKPFDYLIDVASGGAPAVAFARFTAVANVINTTTTVSTTQAGYILVKVGTVSKHIPLYSV